MTTLDDLTAPWPNPALLALPENASPRGALFIAGFGAMIASLTFVLLCVAAWRRAWERVIPFFAFPPAVRKVIYTTNAIESINARLRKIIKTRGHFPSDDAATKLIWLALRNITADWGRAAHDWKAAMNQFAILYEDRFTQAAHGISK